MVHKNATNVGEVETTILTILSPKEMKKIVKDTSKENGSKVKKGDFQDCMIEMVDNKACIVVNVNHGEVVFLTSEYILSYELIKEKFRLQKMKNYYYYNVTFKDNRRSYIRISEKYRKALVCYAQSCEISMGKNECDKTVKCSIDDANETYNLGIHYYTGDGIEQNFELAYKNLLYAAECGLPKAQYHLGVDFLQNSSTGYYNQWEAIKWMRKAISQKKDIAISLDSKKKLFDFFERKIYLDWGCERYISDIELELIFPKTISKGKFIEARCFLGILQYYNQMRDLRPEDILPYSVLLKKIVNDDLSEQGLPTTLKEMLAEMEEDFRNTLNI